MDIHDPEIAIHCLPVIFLNVHVRIYIHKYQKRMRVITPENYDVRSWICALVSNAFRITTLFRSTLHIQTIYSSMKAYPALITKRYLIPQLALSQHPSRWYCGIRGCWARGICVRRPPTYQHSWYHVYSNLCQECRENLPLLLLQCIDLHC